MKFDAAVEKDSIGMALVARDHGGKLIVLQSTFAATASPDEANIKTLVWATYIASF